MAKDYESNSRHTPKVFVAYIRIYTIQNYKWLILVAMSVSLAPVKGMKV
jgi:hypothetical protein